MSRRLMRKLKPLSIYIAALLVAFFVLAPPLWLVISSISTQSELLSAPVHWIPEKPTFERYLRVLLPSYDVRGAEANFRLALLNSVIISTATMLITVSIGSLAAYAFTRLRMRAKGFIMYIILLVYLLPPIAIIIPLYQVISAMRLLDTRMPLIVLYSGILTPFVIWLLRSYFQSIPRELEEAAEIDGCTPLAAFVRIILPLASPGLAATALFSFLMAWEEFFFAFILTSRTAKTVPVAIAEFTGRHSVDFGMMATGGVLAAIPPVLIALLFQRYLVGGLTAGAVKG